MLKIIQFQCPKFRTSFWIVPFPIFGQLSSRRATGDKESKYSPLSISVERICRCLADMTRFRVVQTLDIPIFKVIPAKGLCHCHLGLAVSFLLLKVQSPSIQPRACWHMLLANNLLQIKSVVIEGLKGSEQRHFDVLDGLCILNRQSVM